jgi:aminoglycoside phosphotransferase (APT) family kinase protein
VQTQTIQELLLPLLKEEIGSNVEIANYKVVNQLHDYLVILVQLDSPSIKVVIKLAGLEALYDCPYDRVAALHNLVTTQTAIPMPEIIAVDITYQKWPWRYLIRVHAPGEEWAVVRHQMTAEQLSDAYHQIGRAVAQLHSIQFPSFGRLTADAKIKQSQPYLPALQAHTGRIIKSKRLHHYFLTALNQYAPLFNDITTANLSHEDLHQHNILFENRQGQWHLLTILDFDKAWAGHYESDLARLDLWTEMTNEDFWQAYTAVRPVEPLYPQRRPIYQLLWCLEYAQPTAKHLADTQQLCQELGLPIIENFD